MPPPGYGVHSSGGLRPASSVIDTAVSSASASAYAREPGQHLQVAQSQAQSVSPPALQQLQTQASLGPQQVDITPSPGVALQVWSMG